MEQTVERSRRGGRRLGRRAKVLVLAVVALLVAAACETSAEDRALTLDLINGSRAGAGAPAVVAQADVDAEADRWARAMRDACSLSHRPDLSTGIPAGWVAIGENVGVSSQLPWESDADVLHRLHDGFLGSASHRATMLNAGYDQVGIGAVKGDCPNVGADQPEYWIVEIFVAVG